MEKNKILQNIRKVAPKHCDNCGAKYTPADFTIFKAQETNALVHLKCSGCGNTYVINAFVNESGYGSQRMPLVLDLEGPAEIEKFTELDPVDKDDAIDLFSLLNSGKAEEILFGDTKKRVKAKDVSSRRESKN